MKFICQKDCANRCPGCHDKCEAYQKGVKEVHAEKEWLKKQNSYGRAWSRKYVSDVTRRNAHADNHGLKYFGG